MSASWSEGDRTRIHPGLTALLVVLFFILVSLIGVLLPSKPADPAASLAGSVAWPATTTDTTRLSPLKASGWVVAGQVPPLQKDHTS